MSYTPGPWAVEADDDGESFRIKSDDWGGIAYIHDPLAKVMGRLDELAANARLMALSPEMAETISDLVRIADEFNRETGKPDREPYCILKARALLARIKVEA